MYFLFDGIWYTTAIFHWYLKVSSSTDDNSSFSHFLLILYVWLNVIILKILYSQKFAPPVSWTSAPLPPNTMTLAKTEFSLDDMVPAFPGTPSSWTRTSLTTSSRELTLTPLRRMPRTVLNSFLLSSRWRKIRTPLNCQKALRLVFVQLYIEYLFMFCLLWPRSSFSALLCSACGKDVPSNSWHLDSSIQ